MTACSVPGAGNSALPLIHHFGEVESTLDTAFQLIAERRLSEWDSVLARSQTKGRGQMRRFWDSPPGNLYAALRLPATDPFDSIAASVAVGAICANGLRSFGCAVRLKWPNDLVIDKDGELAKVGGILIEERGGCILAGIGINIAYAPTLSQMRDTSALPAADMNCEAGERRLPSPEELWRSLLRHLYSVCRSGVSFERIWRDAADELLLWRDKSVIMQDGEGRREGVLKGIGKNGGALLESGGQIKEVTSGSLWLANQGEGYASGKALGNNNHKE